MNLLELANNFVRKKEEVEIQTLKHLLDNAEHAKEGCGCRQCNNRYNSALNTYNAELIRQNVGRRRDQEEELIMNWAIDNKLQK